MEIVSKKIDRIPLEDMKELWAWGFWKESMPPEFSCEVFVVCTSREACRRYFYKKTSDLWLLSEEEADSGAVSVLGRKALSFDEDIFAAGHELDSLGKRKFRSVSISHLVEEVCRDYQHLGTQGLTVVVNPRHDSNGQIDADAMFSAHEFLATFAK